MKLSTGDKIVLRVWAQWGNSQFFVGSAPDANTLYAKRATVFATAGALPPAADRAGGDKVGFL